MRSNLKIGEPILVHKKGSKVVGLHCNPVQPDVLLSCGNDHFVSIVVHVIASLNFFMIGFSMNF